MGFGFTKAHLDASTPKSVNSIVNITSAVLPVIVAYIANDPFISAGIKAEAAGIGALLIGIGQSIRPFFGTPEEAPAPDKEPIK